MFVVSSLNKHRKKAVVYDPSGKIVIPEYCTQSVQYSLPPAPINGTERKPTSRNRKVGCSQFYSKGAPRTCYAGPQIIKPGETKTEFGFNLALNDPAGEWTIKAVELTSGKTVEHKLLVEE